MTRIFNNTARTILQTLLYVAHGHGATAHDAKRWVAEKWRTEVGKKSGHTWSKQYHTALNTDDGEAQELTEIIKELTTQVNQNEATHDGPLIDQVVRLLGLPYGRNVLSGKTLTALRRAVLFPEEMAKLGERLHGTEYSCSGCGVAFTDREAVTFRIVEGFPTLSCSKCITPSYTHCKSCTDGVVQIDKRTQGGLQKGQVCLNCKEGGEKPPPAPEPDLRSLVGEAAVTPVVMGNPFDYPSAVLSTTAPPVWTASPPRPLNQNTTNRIIPGNLRISTEAIRNFGLQDIWTASTIDDTPSVGGDGE